MSSYLDRIIDILTALETERHISSVPGVVTTPPIEASKYTTAKSQIQELKNSPIDDEQILSDLGYTDK